MDNWVHFRNYRDDRLSRAIRHMVKMWQNWNDWLHMWHWEPRGRHSGRMLLRSNCLLPGWCLMWWVLRCKWIGAGKLTLPLRLDTWRGQLSSLL